MPYWRMRRIFAQRNLPPSISSILTTLPPSLPCITCPTRIWRREHASQGSHSTRNIHLAVSLQRSKLFTSPTFEQTKVIAKEIHLGCSQTEAALGRCCSCPCSRKTS